MARALPPYRGLILNGKTPAVFSEECSKVLRSFFPDTQAAVDSAWVHPADQFVNEVLAEASWAPSMLYHLQQDIIREELQAEWKDLQRILTAAENKLLSISPALDQLLDLDSDPIGCAEHARETLHMIGETLGYLESIASQVENFPSPARIDQKKHWAAVEMAVRVLRVLKSNGILATEYASDDHKTQSAAVEILTILGREIGFGFAPTTWRDIIGEAKEKAPDLSSR